MTMHKRSIQDYTFQAEAGGNVRTTQRVMETAAGVANATTDSA